MEKKIYGFILQGVTYLITKAQGNYVHVIKISKKNGFYECSYFIVEKKEGKTLRQCVLQSESTILYSRCGSKSEVFEKILICA